MNRARVWIAMILVLGALGSALGSAADVVAGLPVQHEGRVKPLDTFARVHLLAFSGRRSVKGLGSGEWLLDVLSTPDGSGSGKIFKIRNPEVVTALGLKKKDKRIYTFTEVTQAMRDKEAMLRELHDRDESDRSLVENQLAELYSAILRYQEISRSVSCLLPLFAVEDPALARSLGLEAGQRTSYRRLMRDPQQIEALLAQVRKKGHEGWTEQDRRVVALVEHLNAVAQDSFSDVLRLIPPTTAGEEVWKAPWELVESETDPDPRQVEMLDALEGLFAARFRGDTGSEEAQARRFSAIVASLPTAPPRWKLSLETWYNRVNLFVKSLSFYILSFLLLAVSWMVRPRLFRALALWSLIAGCLLHAGGLVIRMLIMGRAPVSTLYESIIFVGMVAAVSGVVVELLRRDGLGIFLGAVAGAVLQFVGFGQAADGDTMGMLVAVLNSNFWLSTHVVTITIGYGCSLVAGLAGHLYLFFRLRRGSTRESLEGLNRNMVGLTLVALFFTLFGTILGGIWADQSWGRFWGWDPKENGALLIVIWQLMLLHGRINGFFRPAGFALGLVLSNIVVAVAWFGVNLLNVGLHTYGFTDQMANNLAIFSAAELVYGLSLYGFIRWREWRVGNRA